MTPAEPLVGVSAAPRWLRPYRLLGCECLVPKAWPHPSLLTPSGSCCQREWQNTRSSFTSEAWNLGPSPHRPGYGSHSQSSQRFLLR